MCLFSWLTIGSSWELDRTPDDNRLVVQEEQNSSRRVKTAWHKRKLREDEGDYPTLSLHRQLIQNTPSRITTIITFCFVRVSIPTTQNKTCNKETTVMAISLRGNSKDEKENDCPALLGSTHCFCKHRQDRKAARCGEKQKRHQHLRAKRKAAEASIIIQCTICASVDCKQHYLLTLL